MITRLLVQSACSTAGIGVVNGRQASKVDQRAWFVDPVTGAFFQVPAGDADVFLHPSCSPWHDAQGRREVVAGWIPKRPDGLAPEATGLARFTFPSTNQIQRIPCEPFPIGEPAWYPHCQARILYPGVDGRLHHLSFEDGQGGMNGCSLRGPTQLRWDCTPPGSGEVWFRDVFWPSDPRLGGKLISK